MCVCFSLAPVQAQRSDPLKSREQVDLERAHFLVTQAFEEDEKGNDDEAIELYTQAVELCINTVRLPLLLSCFLSLTDQFLNNSFIWKHFLILQTPKSGSLKCWLHFHAASVVSVFATVQPDDGPCAAD